MMGLVEPAGEFCQFGSKYCYVITGRGLRGFHVNPSVMKPAANFDLLYILEGMRLLVNKKILL